MKSTDPQQAGKRLPTEAEWEKSARGTDGRKYPWGNLFNLDIEGVTVHANIGSDDLMSVGCFPTDVSPYGVYNMAGNVENGSLIGIRLIIMRTVLKITPKDLKRESFVLFEVARGEIKVDKM